MAAESGIGPARNKYNRTDQDVLLGLEFLSSHFVQDLVDIFIQVDLRLPVKAKVWSANLKQV